VRAALALVLALGGCAGAIAEPADPELAAPSPPPNPDKASPPGCRTVVEVGSCEAGQRLAIDDRESSLHLGAGRWVVMVSAPARSYVTIGVSGRQDALVAFDVVGHDALRSLRSGALGDDGRLPAFVAFETGDESAEVPVIVDAKSDVALFRAVAPRWEPPKVAQRPPLRGPAPDLVGLPFPLEKKAGYVLAAPTRYLFVRTDVAAALRAAFHQTRIRMKRGPIAVGDASQWNGGRPASDLGKPRHISHEGGRDVDVALPIDSTNVSVIERHCEGVLVDKEVLRCAPGTVRGVDTLRLAYFLGLLLDGPTPGGRYVPDVSKRPGPIAVVDTIFTDEVYILEIRNALEELRKKKWIHDEAYGALGEEGLLRPSPWHTDHVHIRFQGQPATVPPSLSFEPTLPE
jgi:hypothetical protein